MLKFCKQVMFKSLEQLIIPLFWGVCVCVSKYFEFVNVSMAQEFGVKFYNFGTLIASAVHKNVFQLLF